jgi:CRP-like cAMP-binding protein
MITTPMNAVKRDDRMFAPLHQRGWLSRQPLATRAAVERFRRVFSVPARETLAWEGDDDVRLYAILSDYIGCYISHLQQRPVLATMIGPGTWFGGGPLIDGQAWQLTCDAMEPCEVIALGPNELAKIRNAAPDFDRHLAELTNLQVRYTSDIISELLIADLPLRVAAVLFRLCEAMTGPVFLPLLQAELAERSNASRSSVSKTLKALEREALLELCYGGISVSDPHALRSWLERASRD